MKVAGGILLLIILCALLFHSNIIDGLRAPLEATVPALGPEEMRPPAYDFKIKTATGETSLAGFRGRIVYVNFWAEWCEPCLDELPVIESLAKEYADRLQVVMINLDQTEASLSRAKELQVKVAPTPLQIYEGAKELEELLNVRALPYHLLVDKQGRTAAAFYTTFMNQVAEFRRVLETLLSEK